MIQPRRPRWWPAILIGVATAMAILWVWWRSGSTRQSQVLATLGLGVLAMALLGLWVLAFSRFPVRTRLLLLGMGLLLGALLGTLLEVRGVSGDLVPLVGWRWSADSDRGLGSSSEEASRQVEMASSLPGATDFPQFLGPRRNATVAGPRLARNWEARPPKEIWRRSVGAAWSGFAVVGRRALTQEQWDEEEAVVAYDLATGERLWSHTNSVRYQTSLGGIGPRATPTIASGRVYTVGATGLLNALDLETGRLLWHRDLVAEHSLPSVPEWGKSGSPLVVEDLVLEDLVVVTVGGIGTSLVAYSADSGEEVWSAGNDFSGYSSPMVATLAGVRQIVAFNEGSVTGHSLGDGAVLWSYPWYAGQPNVAQPLVLGDDLLLVSTGYSIGSHLLQLKEVAGEFSVETLWESPRLKLKFTQAVEHEGFVYGLDDGVLVCLDPKTGERKWKKGRYGHGQILLVGDLLLLQMEDGELLLIEPHPDELRELGRIPVLDGRAWNTLALAGPLLLVRNDREAALYQLPLEAS